MRQAQYTGDRTIEVGDGTEQDPGPGEVRLRVAYVGLCGTDIHILEGHMDARVARPLVFGHEMSGVVDRVGEGVEGWREGDPATVMPLRWDGTCPACVAGHRHICQHLEFMGVDSPGALQTTWTVPAATLVRLPDGVPLDVAALAEPTAVAVHDVRRGEVAPGDRVVVLGGGPIGVLIATVARSTGADVAVAEVDATRRAVIGGLGFETIDPIADDPADWVERWTGGVGADVVFEVSGAASAVRTATGLAKVRGTVVVVAIHPVPREVDLHRVFWRELRIVGARVYERQDFEQALRLLADGVIPSGTLISEIVPLDRTRAAFDQLQSGGAMKVLVDVGGAAGAQA